MNEAIQGFQAALLGVIRAYRSPTNRAIFGSYLYYLSALSFTLSLLGAYGLYSWLWPIEARAWYFLLASWLLLIFGGFFVLISAPFLAAVVCNLFFPLFGERIFLHSLAERNRARAEQLSQAPGLGFTRSLVHSLRRTVLLLGYACLAFVLGLVPLVGIVLVLLIQVRLIAPLLTWELLDPYFDKRGLTFTEQRRALKDKQAAVMGFGVLCVALFSVPLLGPLFFLLLQSAAADLVDEVFPEGREG